MYGTRNFSLNQGVATQRAVLAILIRADACWQVLCVLAGKVQEGGIGAADATEISLELTPALLTLAIAPSDKSGLLHGRRADFDRPSFPSRWFARALPGWLGFAVVCGD